MDCVRNDLLMIEMQDMRALIKRYLEWAAKRSIQGRCVLNVSKHAQVSYRGFKHRPPSQLTIGEGSIFMGQISSDRDGSIVVIGKNTFVGGSKLVCAQRIEIGDDVLISWGCTIVDHDSHSTRWSERANDVKDTFSGRKDWSSVNIRPVTIGNRAWIGFDVSILRGVHIGEGAVVGACSVVTKDVAPHTIVAGNPARFVREVSND